MPYFPEALVTDESNLCLGITLNRTGLNKHESSWVEELSFDRYVEKSSVQTTNVFHSIRAEKISELPNHLAMNEFLGSLDTESSSLSNFCLFWAGFFGL